MATFNPSGLVRVCQVPIDATQQNQIYFSTEAEQKAYFLNKTKHTFTNYLTVRKTLPSGELGSALRVEKNIDELYDCNYICYQNYHHGSKWFYAFITKLIYINEETTEICFETDVYQTWRFEAELKESFVVREHSKTDGYGENIVPEKFNFNDFEYSAINKTNVLSSWGYLVCTSEPRGESALSRGRVMSGVYQGLYFYFFRQDPDSPEGVHNDINAFLDEMETKSDCVQFITLIPSFCIGNASVADDGYVSATYNAAQRTVTVLAEEHNYTFDGYEPKNKKLFNNPYCNLVVMNGNGDEAVYNFEDFDTTLHMQAEFKMFGDISATPSVTLIPSGYKGTGTQYEFGISLSGFPQCSFHSDSFKLWLAKGGAGATGANALFSGVGSIMFGASMVATGGIGTLVGAQQIVQGSQAIVNSITTTVAAQHEPNRSNAGNGRNNLLTAIKQNDFQIYIRKIKRSYAETIDNFFTMYGYQTNRMKVPNVSSRPHFNYVQTANVNIVGDIPSDDMLQLKAIYNRGVTLWHWTSEVGDYSVDNSPV